MHCITNQKFHKNLAQHFPSLHGIRNCREHDFTGKKNQPFCWYEEYTEYLTESFSFLFLSHTTRFRLNFWSRVSILYSLSVAQNPVSESTYYFVVCYPSHRHFVCVPKTQWKKGILPSCQFASRHAQRAVRKGWGCFLPFLLFRWKQEKLLGNVTLYYSP